MSAVLAARLLMFIAACAAVACGADTSTEERPRSQTSPVLETDNAGSIAVPQNAVDRAIRRDLTQAISADPDLRSRDISFIVSNGDISVTGEVRTEDERKKFNDLAMGIGGVKSVANNLRIAE